MKLRARVALAALAALAPLLAGLYLLVGLLRAQVIEEALAQQARALAAASGAACDADPPRWGGRELELEFYAYDLELRAANPAAPALAPELVAAVRAGERQVARLGDPLEVLVQTRDAGPCAFTLLRRAPARPLGPPRGPLLLLVPLVCALSILGLVLALLGPLVRRIRRLRDEVRASADAGYRGAVTLGGADEVSELARAFADSSRQIVRHIEDQERRERTLREFLANTTHDVMIPFTVLQGHLAALAARLGEGDPTVRAAMIEADYIASLIHNLEVAARLDAGEPALHRDPLDLCALVERVAARHAPLARRRQIELAHATPSAPVAVTGDLTLVERALSNLVQNAVLHNHAEGHVALVLEVEGGRFSLLVRDDGPGLAPDELARVLGQGARGDAARTRHPHGTGLGLAIARRIAAAHGWQLELRPGPEGGLDVELRGPLTDPRDPPAPPPPVRRDLPP